MPWSPLPGEGVAFAICVHPFRATHPQDLPLQIGDNLYIIERGGANNEWCRGYLVAPPSLLSGLTSERGQHLDHRVFTGIFPRNCVEIREHIGGNKAVEMNGIEYGDETNGVYEGGHEDLASRRKSQSLSARRLSRALVKKRSQPDIIKNDRLSLFDSSEALVRDPDAPKPSAPVPLLRIGDETGQSMEEPLVDEIASCLREWHDARLHDMLLAREDIPFEPLTDLTKRLDISRKQLLHDVMTARELATLREDTVWDLVAGNKMMHDDVIVRCPMLKGKILEATYSVIEMTRAQANMSILDRPPKPHVDVNMHYHLLLDIRNVVYDFDDASSLQLFLCKKAFGEKPRAITEMYAVSLPLAETPAEKGEQQPKSLFVDLSSTDIGVSNNATALYAIFKLIRDEPIRRLMNQPTPSHQHKTSASSLSAAAGSIPQRLGTNRGRRGIFGSQRKIDHVVYTGPETSRPGTVESRISQTESQRSTAEPRRSRETRTVKRTLGLGVIEVSKITPETAEHLENVTFWTPTKQIDDDRSDETDDWQEMTPEILHSTNGGYSRITQLKHFEVAATMFASPELSTLYRTHPTQLYNVHMTQKLGFTGVPKQKRNDIYLTLVEPLIGRYATLQHAKYGNVPIQQRASPGLKNLQLTLEVRRTNGERIEGCIYTAANQAGLTAWRTTGVESDEAWNQTIKLVVPADEVKDSHVVMSIADAPNFPFALAWMPLWEHDAFVRDGDHQVALYVYDEYSSSMINGRGAYQGLPAWHDKKNEPTYGTSATLGLRTLLCSTEYSQDPTLLGLLQWRKYHGTELLALLERFQFVPEIEIVKLLSDVIEALFQILDEYAGSEIHEDCVFHNWIVLMNIARDKRYNLPCIIENYALSLYNWPHASKSLLSAYLRLLANPLDLDVGRKLRATFKLGDCTLKLIIWSRRTSKYATTSSGSNGIHEERYPEFEQDLQKLFVAIMALMRNPMAKLIGEQTLVVQYFHNWLPELRAVWTPMEVLEVAINLLDACSHAKGQLLLFRLVLILNYSHLNVFKDPEVRTLLIANTFRWLDPYWGEVEEVTDQWRDQVRLCCTVVAAQLEELGDDSSQYVPKLVESYAALSKVTRVPKRTFSMLFPSVYPFPHKSSPVDVEVEEAMLELSAILAACLTTQERLYFDANQIDVTDVLLNALQVIKSVLNGEAFPKNWLSLYVSHHRLAITGLERIFEVIVDTLPDSSAPDMQEAIEFDTELWRAFFDTLFKAVSGSALAIETFPEQKRSAVWKIAGDVREMGADLVKRSWNAIGWETDIESRELHGCDRIGGYQVQFVPELVGPIVKLCLSVHAGLRSAATEVLRTMVLSTWEIDQDLSAIQSAMVDCLDKLCRSQEVSETTLQTTFITSMVAQFEPLKHSIEDSLYHAVVDMFARIGELLDMLSKVHQVGASNDTARIMDTLRLMEFFRDVRSDEAYVRYVHQLADLQVAAGNYTEAGLALKMHADLYDWNPTARVDANTVPTMPSQTQFERKESLYFEMCQHFERSKSWKAALRAYQELAHEYEHNTFDFAKLARSQRAMASIHETIAKGDRISARYFRVVYKGLGFPQNLRDREYIMEGLPSDRLATFEERLKQLHPTAVVVRSSSETDVEGQYLHVYPVSVYKDLTHTVYQRTKVLQAAREYALLSTPNKFTFTSRQPQHDVPITEQIVEKVIYTTKDSFPTILRRSEIISAQSVTLSSVEAAVERTTRKTQELLAIEKRLASGTGADDMIRLADELLLAVDSDSDSSVSRYRTLLPRALQGKRLSGETDYDMLDSDEDLTTPMQSALNAALLDHTLAIKRCLARFTGAQHAAAKAELVPRFEASFERELDILFPAQQGVIDDSAEDATLGESTAGLSVPRGPDSADVAELPAVSGASDEDQPRDLASRQSRRRSIPFLKRIRSSSSLVNGTAEHGEDGRQSRQSSHSRSGSRQRGNSLTRRLSFFRSQSDGDDGLRSPSAASHRDKESNGGALSKRLSFLKLAGRSGLTGSREGD